MITKIAPQWIVENLENSIKFYTEELGFEIDWIGENNPLFAILSRDGFSLILRQLKKENLARPNKIPFIEAGWHTQGKEAWDVYIWINDADTLYNEFKKKDVTFIKEIQDTNYGNRDFEIEDPDGYILCFGHII